MGGKLVRGLCEAGWDVRALVLPGDPGAGSLEGTGCQVFLGDIREPASLTPAFDDVQTVYHLAAVIVVQDPRVLDAVNRVGTANVLAAAVAGGAQHLIYASSASVTYPQLTDYGRSKLAAEQLVQAERRLAHTIVRPTLVYDEAGGGQELAMFLAYLRRFPVVPFIGPGRAIKRPVFAGDVVAGLLAIVDNPATYGRTYNLSGGDSIPILELAQRLLERHGGRKRFLHVPVSACRLAAAVLERCMADPPLNRYTIAAMTQDADLDCADAVRDLGYRPVGTLEGLARCFPSLRTAVRSP